MSEWFKLFEDGYYPRVGDGPEVSRLYDLWLDSRDWEDDDE